MFWLGILFCVILALEIGFALQSFLLFLCVLFVAETVWYLTYFTITISKDPSSFDLERIDEYKITFIRGGYFTYATPDGFITLPLNHPRVSILSTDNDHDKVMVKKYRSYFRTEKFYVLYLTKEP